MAQHISQDRSHVFFFSPYILLEIILFVTSFIDIFFFTTTNINFCLPLHVFAPLF